MRKAIVSLLGVGLFLLAGCGEPAEYVVLGGGVIPEEGNVRAGYALEGEDLVSPGPTITVRVGEPVTITFKNVHEIPPVHHNLVIVAEKDKNADPLWGAKTERLLFGEEQSITFTPDTPGEYFYICSETDHLRRGMWGSLIVEE